MNLANRNYILRFRNMNNPEKIIVAVEDLLNSIAVNYFCRGVKMGAALSFYMDPNTHNPEE